MLRITQQPFRNFECIDSGLKLAQLTELEKIKHLYFRAGFGMSPTQLVHGRSSTLSDEIRAIFIGAKAKPDIGESRNLSLNKSAPSFLSKSMFDAGSQMNAEQELEIARNQWIRQMAEDGPDLLQKMVYFWHCHFACVCPTAQLANGYRQTLTDHALGNYRDLVLAVAKSPAMIRFLNNQQNRKQRANENFARELMEVFTLGEGHYSEADVRAAARAFTGWSSDKGGKFVFRRNLHDYGPITFRGHTGRLSGEDIVDIILMDKQAAHFLASKLHTFFVNDLPDATFVDQIAAVLIQSHFDLSTCMRFIFEHPSFYHVGNMGKRIKSPVELLVHLIKLLDLTFEDENALTFLQNTLGQTLYRPPNVAGWPANRNWINNATLMLRLNLVKYLVDATGFDHAPTASLKASGPMDVIQTINLQKNLDPLITIFAGTSFDVLEDQIKSMLLAGGSKQKLSKPGDTRSPDFIQRALLRTMQLPEFQLC
ncbi:MAG: DUF1800 domain-containing protein [Saprospiraceae bacterium]|nr:DUF1800 domain-containing protein [Saprospiraceae bacterium]